MAEECDFFDAVFDEVLRFLQKVCHFPAFFPAAHVRHDAVGAKIVAAVHDGDISAESFLPKMASAFGNIGIKIKGQQRALFCFLLIQIMRQQGKASGAEDNIDMAAFFEKSRDRFLL
ncbi:hypothetical protein DSECCO2_616900 [anaerobic digester metagenome]